MSKPNVFQRIVINNCGKPKDIKSRQILSLIKDENTFLTYRIFYFKNNVEKI